MSCNLRHPMSLRHPVCRVATMSRPLEKYVSFAEYSLFYRSLLQKRHAIWRRLLIEATPYALSVNASGHLCEWVVSNISVCCVALSNELYRTHGMRHVARIHETSFTCVPCRTYTWDIRTCGTPHSYVYARIHETWHTCEWGMLCVWMSQAIYANELCRTHQCVV